MTSPVTSWKSSNSAWVPASEVGEISLKRVLQAILALVVLVGFALPGMAAAEVKIGVVNIARIMEQAPQAEAASKLLEKRFSQRDASLSEERDAIRKLEEQLQRDGDVMAANKRAELEKEVRERGREYKRSFDNFKEDVNIARNEELAKLQKQVLQAIAEIAEKEQYDLIVTENVVYASKRVDLTEKVLARLKEMFNADKQPGATR